MQGTTRQHHRGHRDVGPPVEENLDVMRQQRAVRAHRTLDVNARWMPLARRIDVFLSVVDDLDRVTGAASQTRR
jgi:hypothetical protein